MSYNSRQAPVLSFVRSTAAILSLAASYDVCVAGEFILPRLEHALPIVRVQSKTCMLITPDLAHTTINGPSPQNCVFYTNNCSVCANATVQFASCGKDLRGNHQIGPGQSLRICDTYDPACGNAVHAIAGIGSCTDHSSSTGSDQGHYICKGEICWVL